MNATDHLTRAIELLDAARPLVAQGCFDGAGVLADEAALRLRLAAPWVDASAYRHAAAAAEMCSELCASLDAGEGDAVDQLRRVAAAVVDAVNREQAVAVGEVNNDEAIDEADDV